jgi:phosphate transport system protein
MSTSSRRTLDRELDEIHQDLLKLGELVVSAIERAIGCLQTGNADLARQVVDEDRRVNALRFHVEEECLATIATQQPTATDLRRVLTGITLAGDLERMGDYAAGIAKTVLRMPGAHAGQPQDEILQMAAVCTAMVRQSLLAIEHEDPELARQVAERDDEVDRLYNHARANLLAYMLENPEQITWATYLLWCAHNLERLGDRATNIGERVIFMTTGTMKELNT